MATISDNIFARCLPAYSSDIDRCSGATLCNISPTTQDELENIYADTNGKYRIMGALLEADFTGKACNVKQNGMYDLIQMTRRDFGVKRLGGQQLNHGLAEVWPFIKMKRKQPINNEYWTADQGSGAGGTTPNTGESYDYSVRVTSQTGIPADTRWFPARTRVTIFGKTAGGTAVRGRYKVLDATASGQYVTIYCESQNSASNLDPVKVIDLSTGVLVRGTPNVNDYEQYCAQIPGLNTNQLTPFFIETTRVGWCEDELYMRYIKALKDGNPYFAQFGDVESVELNRQILEDYQRRQAWTFFFNPPLDNQNLTNWDQLEQITVFSDDALGNYMDLPFEGRCIGRRANATGVYEQLAECGRVYDLQGQPLSIPELQNAIYELRRVRQANGVPVDVIELMTDSYFAKLLGQAFLAYFKSTSQDTLVLNKDIQYGSNSLGFYWTEFTLDYPIGQKIRIVTHDFFDDFVSAARNVNSDLMPAATFLLALDWTSIYKAQVESNSIVLSSGDIKRLAEVNEAFMCIMKNPKKTQRLMSETYSVVVDCVSSSAWWENIARTQPSLETDNNTNSPYYYPSS